MRVADQQIFGQVVSQFQQISQKTLEAQLQASTGKRVSKLSDDPVAFGRIVLDQTDLAQTNQWLRNIDSGTTRLASADNALGQVDTILSRIKELAVSARSDTNTANDRNLIAKEVRELHRELIQLSNTEINGQRIFAGTKTDTDPFGLGSNNTVTYAGNSETQSIAVGRNQSLQVTVPGDQIFTGATTNVFDSVKNLLAAENRTMDRASKRASGRSIRPLRRWPRQGDRSAPWIIGSRPRKPRFRELCSWFKPRCRTDQDIDSLKRLRI